MTRLALNRQVLAGLICVALLGSCGDDSSPTKIFLDIAGTWTVASITSPTAPACNVVSGGTVVFSQSGASITGDFTLTTGVTGVFEGTIDASDNISGVFTETIGACTGGGNFTGTASASAISVSIPTITSSTAGCLFCQDNTVSLTR